MPATPFWIDFNILNLVIKPRIHHEPEKTKCACHTIKLSSILHNVAKDGLQSYTFLEYDLLIKWIKRNLATRTQPARLYHCKKKMKFYIKDFSRNCDQIRRKLQICSHLLEKSLMENFFFCAVYNKELSNF